MADDDARARGGDAGGRPARRRSDRVGEVGDEAAHAAGRAGIWASARWWRVCSSDVGDSGMEGCRYSSSHAGCAAMFVQAGGLRRCAIRRWGCTGVFGILGVRITDLRRSFKKRRRGALVLAAASAPTSSTPRPADLHSSSAASTTPRALSPWRAASWLEGRRRGISTLRHSGSTGVFLQAVEHAIGGELCLPPWWAAVPSLNTSMMARAVVRRALAARSSGWHHHHVGVTSASACHHLELVWRRM